MKGTNLDCEQFKCCKLPHIKVWSQTKYARSHVSPTLISVRDLLHLDGTHLKGKYLGILLTATAVDANGSLFPLSYAIVDAENDENWLWFNSLLHTVIDNHAPGYLMENALTFVSDRQKGLLESVERVFPGSPL